VSNTIINSWESQRKPGTPGEFVLFGLFPIDFRGKVRTERLPAGLTLHIADDSTIPATATATIGQRTKDGRLYQKAPKDRLLYYRKFVISREQAHIQIPALIKLAAAFNASPTEVLRLVPPGKPVVSAKAWAEVYAAIEQGASHV
jgi:hypothetical protein